MFNTIKEEDDYGAQIEENDLNKESKSNQDVKRGNRIENGLNPSLLTSLQTATPLVRPLGALIYVTLLEYGPQNAPTTNA